MSEKKITYCLVNNLGGITTMLQNVARYPSANNIEQEAILLNVQENNAAPIMGQFCEGVATTEFNFSNKENWYHIFGRLAKITGESSGVLIANDVYEMLMLSYYNIPKKVIQVVHDGYNVQLAISYSDVVDVFICHSYFFYEVMCQLIPGRRKEIFFIPYGVPISGYRRTTAKQEDALKLFFLGRHHEAKGIFDLITIEHYLEAAGVPTDWMIFGKGPATAELKEQWKDKKNVVFITPPTNDEVLQQIADRDILVFPTRFEGFPVALVEAMSVGCVPVASNLPGGLRELIKDKENGFLCNYEEPVEFAKNIEWLHHNRNELELMSNKAAAIIGTQYDVTRQSPKYHQLFEQVCNSNGNPAHHSVKRKLGSRLDRPWIPNALTKFARNVNP
jgi:glycosyltransferase involved in cell wall biosynthesis